jgi:transcriptional regulator with XRE-family HTH domain
MSRKFAYSEHKLQLSERIKDYRKSKGLNQRKFAKLLGYSYGYIADLERGRQKPSREFIERFVQTFGVSSDYILYGKTKEESIQNELRVFTAKIENTLEEMAKLGAIPKATISDDEIAIIKLLRLLSQRDSIKILEKIIEAIGRDPNIPKGDKYYDRYINIVRDIIQSQRFFSQGIDFDGLIWGYEALAKRKGAAKERRSYPRISLTVPVEFQITDQPESRSGAVINGSQMGFLIQTSHDMPVGSRIHLNVMLPEWVGKDPFRASAEILWKDKRQLDDASEYQYGMKFLEVLNEGHAKLEALINGLQEKRGE